MGGRNQVAKRAFDLMLTTLALPAALPLLLVCAIAVRLDSPGPILFRQLRTGHHGRQFTLYKFRTMVRDAEQLKQRLRHLNVLSPPDFKIPNDPRITRVGRLLRATSLDELPQLVNVLRGDMSLVGPQPSTFSARTYELWHTRRLEAKPGLTGLWQISGRHTTGFDERVRIDEQYIRRQTVLGDLWIVLQTIPALLRKEGA